MVRIISLAFLSLMLSKSLVYANTTGLGPLRHATARIVISVSHYEMLPSGGLASVRREVCRGVAQVPVYDLRNSTSPSPQIGEVFNCFAEMDNGKGTLKVLSNIHLARKLNFDSSEVDNKDFIAVLEVVPPNSGNRVFSTATASSEDLNLGSAGLIFQTQAIRSIPFIQYIFSIRVNFED